LHGWPLLKKKGNGEGEQKTQSVSIRVQQWVGTGGQKVPFEVIVPSLAK